jgi:hypothetical protein
MGFEVIEGFSRPDWKAIYRYVRTHVPKDDLPAAWDCITARWLAELASDLGGNSRVSRSPNFFCLSDLDAETTKTIQAYAEKSVQMIRNCLGAAAWTGYHGKHVLLLFSDPDDYFSYISYFDADGEHILSGGVFIRRGYAHIAIPCADVRSAENALVHELTHNLLCHLPIPLWLNEGLAMLSERLAGQRILVMDGDLADRHRRHWNETNIQAFWAGTLIDVPGDDSELSYSLGEILVSLLSESGAPFADFITHADWRDAGQDAAINWLEKDLGDVLSDFLGPGNWRPERKAIKKCLQP